MGALSNPFDPDQLLWSGCPCGLHASMREHQLALMYGSRPIAPSMAESRFYNVEGSRSIQTSGPADEQRTAAAADGANSSNCEIQSPATGSPDRPAADDEPSWEDHGAVLARCAESAIMKGLFGTDINRRAFLHAVGSSTALAAISQFIPLDKVKAAIVDAKGPLEKKKLNVGFVPITCATPIIMAHPMGFYKKYGLDVDIIKTAGWAVSRDKSLSGEYDAAHMLTPMPLAITIGAGSVARPWTMPAVENINGQAITLHVKHKNKNDPKMWKGFKFAVPFEYSMHNFLLRYYVAEAGLDPDKDIQIRVLPPPEMVANLRADNVDGYLSPDPFNQRAVYDGVGFIHKLTKEIWLGHPCCAFAASQKFINENPNAFLALFKAIVDATGFSSNKSNRKEISTAIAPKNYLNQPVTVIEQVLTGRFADGLGKIRNEPDRIDFDPFPYHSFAVWILTQMKRWGYVKGNLNYKQIAEQVYLATDAAAVMKSMGQTPPTATYGKHMVMGKQFDSAKPEEYIASFAIRRK